MSGWESPPPMAEQLRELIHENRRLRGQVDRVRALLKLAGEEGRSGGIVTGYALRRALDGDPT